MDEEWTRRSGTGRCFFKPEREALCRFAAQNFIYHIPGDPQDGFRRKLERLRGRYPAELETVRLLGDYPSEIIL